MPIPRIPQNDREITYQVGWKKGTIHKKAEAEAPIIVLEDKSAAAYIWFKAPMLPASFDLYVLCLLPIISILGCVTLIYYLKQF